METDYKKLVINGVLYIVTGTLAVAAAGAIAMRRRLKPKNSWNNTKTLPGCTVLITGGNGGIGAAIATELAKRQANVIIACRTRHSALTVISEAKRKFPESKEIYYKHLDLSALGNIKDFVQELDVKNVDILINNAAVWGSPILASADGYEQSFATNYLAPFYLTKLMSTKFKLQKVINISSGLYTKGKIDGSNLEDLVSVPSEMNPDLARQLYSTSKLAQIYFNSELAKRNPEITTMVMHPGLCYTGLARYVKPNSVILGWLGKLLPLIIRTAEEGAQTAVYCCVEDDVVSGGFYGDCAKEELQEVATDPQIQEDLWEFSNSLISRKGY